MTPADALAVYYANPDVKEASTAAITIAEWAEDFEIEDEMTNSIALDGLSRARKTVKSFDGLRKRWLDPLNAQIKVMNGDFANMVAPAKKADEILTAKTAAYRRLLAAAKVAALEDPMAALMLSPEPEIAQTSKTVTTEAGSKVTFRTTPHYEIENEALVPKMYWSIDEKKIGAAVRAGISPIKGVKIWTTEEPVVR
jgi:hypothetical protein